MNSPSDPQSRVVSKTGPATPNSESSRGVTIRSLADFTALTRAVKTTPVWLYLLIYTPASILLVVVFVQKYVDAARLLRDPLQVAYDYGIPEHMPLYYGFVSNIGILLWTSAAAVCLFLGAAIAASGRNDRNGWFLVSAGLLSGLLGTDDLFLVHEIVLPHLIGVNSGFVVGFYVVLTAAHVTAFRSQIFERDAALLGLAMSMFVISVISDLFIIDRKTATAIQWMVEDGAKFLGICGWAGFHISAAWRIMTETLS